MRSSIRFAAIALALSFAACSLAADDAPTRPRILRIASVEILVSDLPAARAFYAKALGRVRDCDWCEGLPGRSFLVNALQGIALSPAPDSTPANLITEITLATDNLPRLQHYFKARNVAARDAKEPSGNSLSVVDPEGHRIRFVQQPASASAALDAPAGLPLRLIHTGFVVRDRAAEDHFYKDLLGFHVYWHGGMNDNETDWVDMQVPDGADWIEYMLNVPANASHKTLGIMNHIALGVPDIHAAQQQLIKNGWKPTEQPKIGRDGKWQLNLYDPDQTRIEFMEFKPSKDPCCSPYTGTHPGPRK